MRNDRVWNGDIGNGAVVQKQGTVRWRLMRHKTMPLGSERQLMQGSLWPIVGSCKDSFDAASQGKREKCW